MGSMLILSGEEPHAVSARDHMSTRCGQKIFGILDIDLGTKCKEFGGAPPASIAPIWTLHSVKLTAYTVIRAPVVPSGVYHDLRKGKRTHPNANAASRSPITTSRRQTHLQERQTLLPERQTPPHKGKRRFIKGKSRFIKGKRRFIKGKCRFIKGKCTHIKGKRTHMKGKRDNSECLRTTSECSATPPNGFAGTWDFRASMFHYHVTAQPGSRTTFDCRGTTQTPDGTTWTTRATTPATFASLKSQYHGLRPLTGNCYLTLTRRARRRPKF